MLEGATLSVTYNDSAPPVSRFDYAQFMDWDANENSVADWWERMDDIDSDGDGASDAEKWAAGTDADDDDSYFHVGESTEGADGLVTLRWGSVEGRRYSIEVSTDLMGPFELFLENIIASPPENTHILAAPWSGEPAYYRLTVQ